MARTELTITSVENGFILDERDPEDFSKPARRRIAKDTDELKKMIGFQGEVLLPSVPIKEE